MILSLKGDRNVILQETMQYSSEIWKKGHNKQFSTVPFYSRKREAVQKAIIEKVKHCFVY